MTDEQEGWFDVTRRYEVEETVYVRAKSKSEALAKCRAGEYDGINDDMRAVSADRWKKAKPVSDEAMKHRQIMGGIV